MDGMQYRMMDVPIVATRDILTYMSKIPASEAARLFEQIIGWPYKLGQSGTNAAREIDCSGAWVRVYKQYGKSVAHGSNSQFRKHCTDTSPIHGVASLHVGMAVFKCRPWTNSEEDRKNQYYGQAPGNIYHVGCVTSVSPLRIVHATSPMAKVDTTLGNWTHWGMMREVDYDAAGTTVDIQPESNLPDVEPTPTTTPTPSRYFAVVSTPNGGPVKMREQPSKNCALYKDVPNGETVLVIGSEVKGGSTWCRVERNSRKWWIMADYLRKLES